MSDLDMLFKRVWFCKITGSEFVWDASSIRSAEAEVTALRTQASKADDLKQTIRDLEAKLPTGLPHRPVCESQQGHDPVYSSAVSLTLTHVELHYIIAMLERLGEYQSAAGCNDYEIPDTPENRGFVRAMISASDYPGDEPHIRDNGMIMTADYKVNGYLIDRLKEEMEAK
jgi:hypothetical protein